MYINKSNWHVQISHCKKWRQRAIKAIMLSPQKEADAVIQYSIKISSKGLSEQQMKVSKAKKTEDTIPIPDAVEVFNGV